MYNDLTQTNVNLEVPQNLLDLIAQHRGTDSWNTSDFTDKFVEQVSALASEHDVDFCELEETLHAAGLY